MSEPCECMSQRHKSVEVCLKCCRVGTSKSMVFPFQFGSLKFRIEICFLFVKGDHILFLLQVCLCLTCIIGWANNFRRIVIKCSLLDIEKNSWSGPLVRLKALSSKLTQCICLSACQILWTLTAALSTVLEFLRRHISNSYPALLFQFEILGFPLWWQKHYPWLSEDELNIGVEYFIYQMISAWHTVLIQHASQVSYFITHQTILKEQIPCCCQWSKTVFSWCELCEFFFFFFLMSQNFRYIYLRYSQDLTVGFCLLQYYLGDFTW